MRHALKLAVSLVTGLGALGLSGCVHFHDQPLSAENTGADFNARNQEKHGSWVLSLLNQTPAKVYE